LLLAGPVGTHVFKEFAVLRGASSHSFILSPFLFEHSFIL
jgi:hypothetical protein